VHGEGGQATVEWVALVLAAAVALAAGAALAGREADRGLGDAVAERITRAAAAPGSAPAAAAAGPVVRKRAISARFRTTSTGEAPRVRAAPPAPASGPRAVDAFRSIRGVADVAKHAWIVCLGYERWRHELEHPTPPSEALPVGVAVSILNTCFNPHDYLLEED
jgi:hypothetical protein